MRIVPWFSWQKLEMRHMELFWQQNRCNAFTKTGECQSNCRSRSEQRGKMDISIRILISNLQSKQKHTWTKVFPEDRSKYHRILRQSVDNGLQTLQTTPNATEHRLRELVARIAGPLLEKFDDIANERNDCNEKWTESNGSEMKAESPNGRHI